MKFHTVCTSYVLSVSQLYQPNRRNCMEKSPRVFNSHSAAQEVLALLFSPKSTLPSTEPATRSRPKPYKCTVSKTEVAITTFRMPHCLQNDLFHLTIRSTILHVFLTSPMHAPCPVRLIYLYLNILICRMPIPVLARSKAWVCGRPPAETVGSNPTGGMEVCLL
jgi:hypothetical protein